MSSLDPKTAERQYLVTLGRTPLERLAYERRLRMDELERERDAAIRARDELRSLLAPLLGQPFVAYGPNCYFCGVFETEAHRPGCPLWRRDALLGRS